MADNNDWQDVEKDDWEDVPVTPQSQNTSSFDQFAGEYAVPALQSLGAGIMDVAGTASTFMDKYGGGASIRAGLGKVAQGQPGEALGAAYEQYGQDPTKAPSFKEIYGQLGVPTTEFETPLITNPYDEKNRYAKMSPAGILGGVTEAVADPLNYVPTNAILRGAVKGAAATGRAIAPKIGKVVARVPEETTKAYMAAPRRIEQTAAMYSPEDIKNIIDETVGEAKLNVTESKAERERLRQQLKEKLRQKRSDLQRETIPSDVVNEIQGSLENQKAVLGQLSLQADEALVKSGKEFTKKGLLDLIDHIGASAGKYVIGDARNNAIQKLNATRQRIEDSVPEFIPAKDVRDILQQIRADIDFDMNAGEFNSDLNRMRKQFASRISENLKNFVPEYSNYMRQMSELADSLEQMSRLFGSEKYPAKGYGTLQSIRKGGRQDIIDAIRRNAELTKNQMLSGTLGKYQRDAALLNRFQRGEDLSKELFPQDASNLTDIEATQKMAEDLYNPMARIQPGSDKAQNVIRRYGQPTASIEDRRAIESIGQSAGVDLPQIISDRAVYDQFNKDATAGSRNAVIGAALAKDAGIVGAGAGALLGGMTDRYGGRMVRGGIRAGVTARETADAVLNYLRNDPEFAGRFGRVLNRGAQYGTRGVLLYHHLLMNNDPNYRQYFQEQQ